MTLAQFYTAPQTPPSEEKTKSPSTLVSRNVTISGRRTSIRLEPEMWDGLREVCRRERSNLHYVCTSVAIQKQESTSLTAAIRVFVMRYFRVAASEEGHRKAGHGFGMTLAMAASPAAAARYAEQPMAALHKDSFA
ncbi:MAG: ribbon-helix-helix domain-containing protein [Alphaproteobacteria bacterium]|nr:ribbon-helix-helix domain-containing protein [Alphaproteobacteria bacterium]